MMFLFIVSLLQTVTLASSKCECSTSDKLHQLSETAKNISLALDTSKVSYQDGPNCFNAVLYAKGYVSELTKTDDSEFAFFLESFCKKKKSAPEKGDVLALEFKNQFYHAAMSLGDGKIFEKLSTWGASPPKTLPRDNAKEMLEERKVSSQYLIKRMVDSKYFNGSDKTGGNLIVYSCADQDEVRSELESLSLIHGIKSIQNLNKKLEEVIFQKNASPDWKESTAELILKTLSEIRVEEVSGKRAKFLTLKLKSLLSQISDFETSTESDVFRPAQMKVRILIDELEQKIK